eukprot:657393-Rhodomonas_salina.1
MACEQTPRPHHCRRSTSTGRSPVTRPRYCCSCASVRSNHRRKSSDPSPPGTFRPSRGVPPGCHPIDSMPTGRRHTSWAKSVLSSTNQRRMSHRTTGSLSLTKNRTAASPR